MASLHRLHGPAEAWLEHRKPSFQKKSRKCLQVSSGFCDRNVSWVRGPIRKWYCHMCGTRRPHFYLTTRESATAIARYPWKILESKNFSLTPMTPFSHFLETIVTSENASNNWTVEGTCHGAISAKGLGNHFQNTSHLQSKTSDLIKSSICGQMWPCTLSPSYYIFHSL